MCKLLQFVHWCGNCSLCIVTSHNFFLIFCFKLLTGPNLGHVLFCQSVINTLHYSRYLYSSLFHTLPQPLIAVGHISLVLSGVWNLEFFGFIIPPFCISEKMTLLHHQMLRFMSAFYPLAMVLITYLFLELSAECNLINRCVRIHRFLNASLSMVVLSI